MFTYLKVKNFALIEDVEIEFKTGFTAFVGETGAGKSLLVDAISILSGARSSVSFLKKGADFSYIEGGFFLKEGHSVLAMLEQNDILFEPGEDILVSRKITSDGRTVCKIQGNIVPVILLKKLMTKLIDIHGQQESSYLLESKNHLFLLDIYAKNSQVLLAYKMAFNEYSQIFVEKEELAALKSEIERLPQYEEMIEQLAKADIKKGEIEEITEQFKALKDFGQTFKLLTETQQNLQKNNLSLQLYQAADTLEKVSQKGELASRLNSLYYELQDIEDELSAEIDAFANQKAQQYQIEQRIETIFSLQKSYGDDLIQARQDLQIKIDKLQNVEYELIQIEKKLALKSSEVQKKANELTQTRTIAAQKLATEIMQQLADLYMENVKFKLDFSAIKLDKNGGDAVEFYIQSNIGSDFQPMAKIASGGELSRIMLAIKVIFAKNQTLAAIIFDEIDTGVSGKVAQAIAKKMQIFGQEQQVFAITHLPQVLAASTQQLLIEKYVESEQTHVKIEYLTAEKHEIEVAKMLSGAEVHQSGVEHAKELISLFN
ncbi:MAG: DNA repair protein RecN [Culicoidibacterales bacterium]